LAKPLAWAAAGMSVAGAILGLMLGLFQHRRLRGAAWGAPIGCLLGLLFAPVLFIPAAVFPELLLTAIAGSAVVIATAAVLRLQTGPAPRPRSSDPTAPPLAPQHRHPLDPDPDEERPAGHRPTPENDTR
jgi:peptidoglycan/LPS O-acetylase OafA/YrhL